MKKTTKRLMMGGSIATLGAMIGFTANAATLMTTNTGASGIYLQGSAGLNYLQNQYTYETQTGLGGDVKYDIGWQGGAAIGYKHQNWRLAFGVRYLRNNVDRVAISNGSGGTTSVGGGNMSALTYLITGYHDFDLGNRWVPYIGLGAGIATVIAKDISGSGGGSNHDNVFAYQNTLGLGYQFNPKWRVFGEYHHLGTSTIKVKSGDDKIKAYYQNNLVDFGVMYIF